MADATIKVIIDAYTRGLEDGMRRSAQATENASKSMTARLADIDLAAQLMQRTITDISGIVGGIYDIGKEGAQLADMERRFMRISGGAEQATVNLEAMRRATKNTVRDAELMERGMAMLASGLAKTDEDLEAIMKTVPALGQAFKGFAADRSMLSYTMMISNGLQSVKMRADDFGISVTTVESRMKELENEGYNTRDALQAAVNEELLRVYDALGLSAETAATKMQQSETALQNFADEAKRGFIPVSYEIAGGLQGIFSIQAGEGMPLILEVLYRIMAGLQAFLPMLEQVTLALVQLGQAWAALFQGDFKRADELWKKFASIMEGVADVGVQAAEDAYNAYVEMYQGVEEEAIEVEEIAEVQADKTVQAYDKMANDIEKGRKQLSDRLAALDLRDARQAEDAAIQAARRQEDIAIQTARRREDMERQLEASLAQARAQAALSAAQAAQSRADALINIERDYQKRLRDIQRDYQMEAADAIRARDALALVRARERRDKELTEAEEQRQEARQEAERAYQRQLEQIQQALQLQIAAALEAHRQQEEDLQRSLRRQEEDEALSNRRKEEDARLSRVRAEADARAAFYAYRSARLQEYQILERDYRNHLIQMRNFGALANAYGGGSAGGSYQEGTPYVPQTGTYTLHQGEAVIPAEHNPYRPSGGGRALLGGVTFNQNFTFKGSFTEGDKVWFRQAAEQAARNTLNEVLTQ